MNVSQQHGTIPGAAETDVAIDIHVGAAPFDARARIGLRFHVERQILQKWRTGDGARASIRCRRKKRRHIHALRKQQPLHLHVCRSPAPHCSCPKAAIVPLASQLMPVG